jgi:predicted DNA-binding transcriptional regulator YafY
MSSKIIYERFLWFQNQIKKNNYPNTKTLAEQFEITRKTAQRDIGFMRDRMGAPLVYLHEKRGFAYADHTYELPGFWLDEESLTSLLLAYRLVSAVPDKTLKTSLRSFLERLLEKISFQKQISLKDLSSKISVRNVQYSQTKEKIYHAILEALLSAQAVRIEYHSPHNSQTTLRDILPLHLLHYMGTWHIIAHCALKNELRDFVLSRIHKIEPCENKIKSRFTSEQVRKYIRKTFGIFQGKQKESVCLCFSKDVSSWIAEQIWHPAQKISVKKDGRLCLTIPVADFREIKREILKYGSQVEVLSPKALRMEIIREIEKIKKIYSSDTKWGSRSGKIKLIN